MESVINYVRDILRKEGITGMESINHCIVFVICRLLDENTCKKTKIDKKFAYTNIMTDDDDDEIGDQELYDRFYMKGDTNCLVGQLVNKLGFTNIKFKLKGIQNLKSIMKKMELFDPKKMSSKYDIIGTIYEIHLKSGTSNAMRDLGQYYTHRLVINYMIKMCDPKMEKGIVEKIVDPTMGTGGFLTMAIKYLNEKYGGKIDWSKNKTNIIGFDIDDNVRNMALLNIFLEIGELCDKTIVKEDTLHNDMRFEDKTILDKAKIILANEPMGLKNITFASCCERIKKDIKGGTKAEPLFLKLFMEALDDDGRCAVIVPDGMLFNASSLHNETRKMLVEKFNLKKIISLSDDFFLNTGVKTSILFFTKEKKKTEEVEFSFIKLKKDDIDETSIIKVKYDELKKNNYILFVNKYNLKLIDKIIGIEYKKLKDVCKFKNGKTITREKCINGEYPVVGGGKIPSCYHDEFNTAENTTICSSSGASAGYISRYSTKIWASDCFSIIPEDKILNNDYLYYYLLHIQDNIYKLQKGSGQPHVYSSDVENLEIPIPSIEIQTKMINMIKSFDNNTQTCKKQLDETKEILKNYIDILTRNVVDEKSCNDLFNMTIGKKTSKDISEDGTYDFYNGSAKAPVGKAIDYSCDNKTPYILIIKDGGAGQGNYGEQIGLGKTFYVSGKTSFTTSVVALVNNDEKKMDTKYLYYYLHSQKNNLMDLAQYTTGLGHMGTTKLKSYMIKTPQLDQQKEIVKYCDKLNEIINNAECQIVNNEKMMKKVMDEYLKSKNTKPNDLINDKKNNSESTDNKDSDSDEDKKPKKIIKKKSDEKTVKKIVKKEKSDSNSDSDSDEDKKPKKIIKKKSDEKTVKKIVKKEKSDSSSDSDSDEDKKPKKIIKKKSDIKTVKKIVKKEESDSSSYSDSDTDDEKTKKKISKKT